MDITNFDLWCKNATKLIRYKPDREAVAKELQDHLQDHYDALIAQGCSHREAVAKSLDAMGSAQEIAPQLAQIHKPWLGYIYSIVRFVAVTAAAFAIFIWVSMGVSLVNGLIRSSNFDSIPANYGPLDYYCQPNVSDQSDGLHFQITEAGYNESASELYFELRMIHLPWMRSNGVQDQLWAIDSMGNYYASRAEAIYESVPKVTLSGSSSSSCITHINMMVLEFDCNAEWIELHYDRDGRDIVLRIDLMGGDGE